MTTVGGKEPRAWRYPPRSEHADEEIFIYDKWCKCCGICYELCPAGVLSSDKAGKPVVENPDACIACYLCERLCPDMAITVYKERKAKAGSANEKEGASDRGGGANG
jgi:2-oxoglutarate ferredoxin oxidoreductase subunit delta